MRESEAEVQALSEQETEATPSAGHPFGSSQEFVRGPPLNQEFMLACMGRRETMWVIGRLGSHLASP